MLAGAGGGAVQRKGKKSRWCHLVGIYNGSDSRAAQGALQCLPGISPGTCVLAQPSQMCMDTGFLLLPK